MNLHRALTRSPVPAHIRPDSIVDYDVYYDHRYDETGDLHQGLFRLSTEIGQGIFWTPHNGGHWFINDRDLLFDAVRQPELFSSTRQTIPPVPEEPKLLPLFIDPPEHGAFRQVLSKAFAPAAMKRLERSIRDFAGELIDGIAPDGRCDFLETIAEPLPIKIFMRMMGMPLDRLREFRLWILDMLSDSDERRASAYANIAALMDELIVARQAKPEADLISELIGADIDGRPVTYDELQAFCLTLFAAGLDTVANSLAFGMNHLAGDRALQDQLRSDPGLIVHAVEEFLRKYGVAMPARTATRDFDFAGVDIREGERIMLMLPAGNFDPKVFPDPFTFDIHRENKVHSTFNAGPHRCVGSSLARIEMRIFYEEWLRRMPNVRHDPDTPSTFRAGLTLALASLPIVWDV